MKPINDTMYIYGAVFGIVNRLETQMGRALNHMGITPRQWYLAAVVNTVLDGGTPTLKEAARAVGSTHQNVKQVAMKLAEKGLAELKKDQTDHRVTRIHINREQEQFWNSVAAKGEDFRSEVFDGIDEYELAITRKVLERMWSNLDRLDEAYERGER